jgi:hypothetical protein
MDGCRPGAAVAPGSLPHAACSMERSRQQKEEGG